jgi:UDP-N-acetylglucosamine diphosphorylase / glucose-1-phosphate thymidylyltransferase / UDP-N-acetylgalactosamine diphosphorylase / glucosamine-1-phosphate N-acetyltransferase / galactosamine-1-phosphate N-acetyltransferase
LGNLITLKYVFHGYTLSPSGSPEGFFMFISRVYFVVLLYMQQNFYPFTQIRQAQTLLAGMFSFAQRNMLLNQLQNFVPHQNIVQIIAANVGQLHTDFALQKTLEKAKPLTPAPNFIGPQNILVEEGAVVENCLLNATEGPIYIAKNALIMDGAILRGPIFVGENSVIKMGATIYGGTTIGQNCIIGGEVKNSIISNFSNKAHHGYLGDSYLGEWCNLGAGTTNSNVKNTASNIAVQINNQTVFAGQKMGVIMADFAKTAINTSINTGTVIGVGANVFCNGLTPKLIPNFAWGVTGQMYTLPKFLTHNSQWLQLKGQQFTPAQIKNLETLYHTKS